MYPVFNNNHPLLPLLASQNRPKLPLFQIGISKVVFVKRTDPETNAEL